MGRTAGARARKCQATPRFLRTRDTTDPVHRHNSGVTYGICNLGPPRSSYKGVHVRAAPPLCGTDLSVIRLIDIFHHGQRGYRRGGSPYIYPPCIFLVPSHTPIENYCTSVYMYLVLDMISIRQVALVITRRHFIATTVSCPSEQTRIYGQVLYASLLYRDVRL